jgi:hypothetical protein
MHDPLPPITIQLPPEPWETWIHSPKCGFVEVAHQMRRMTLEELAALIAALTPEQRATLGQARDCDGLTAADDCSQCDQIHDMLWTGKNRVKGDELVAAVRELKSRAETAEKERDELREICRLIRGLICDSGEATLDGEAAQLWEWCESRIDALAGAQPFDPDLPPELEHPANKMAREAMRRETAKERPDETWRRAQQSMMNENGLRTGYQPPVTTGSGDR